MPARAWDPVSRASPTVLFACPVALVDGFILWCPDSVCPSREKKHVYLGDKNALNLTFHAQNMGEGGAYEAELRVTAPLEAEYSGLVRHPGVRRHSQVGLQW